MLASICWKLNTTTAFAQPCLHREPYHFGVPLYTKCHIYMHVYFPSIKMFSNNTMLYIIHCVISCRMQQSKAHLNISILSKVIAQKMEAGQWCITMHITWDVAPSTAWEEAHLEVDALAPALGVWCKPYWYHWLMISCPSSQPLSASQNHLDLPQQSLGPSTPIQGAAVAYTWAK